MSAQPEDPNNWEFPVLEAGASLTRCAAHSGGARVSWNAFLEGLSRSRACREALTRRLVGLPYQEVFWETPPVTQASADQAFEFVALDAPLRSAANPTPFAEFLTAGAPVVMFANLSGDALLVVPGDLGDGTQYSYLLSFLRSSGVAQMHAFWGAVGTALRERLDSRPVWTSTSGGGVPWLHVRLDDRPKYYNHRAYVVR